MKKTNVFAWRGLLAGAEKKLAYTSFITLVVVTFSMVFTQLGFVSLSIGGVSAHIFAVLMPIMLAGFLFGWRGGTVLGFLAGAMILLHALWFPLDYYEKYFIAPTNSIIMFTLMGFLMSLMLAVADRSAPSIGAKRSTMGALVCVLSSFLCSTFFNVNSYVINSVIDQEVPTGILTVLTSSEGVLWQMAIDAVLLFAVCFTVDFFNQKRKLHPRERSLRQTFQAWLSVVVLLAFMVTSALGYTVVTLQSQREASESLGNDIGYLANQLQEMDNRRATLEKTEQDAIRDKLRIADSILANHVEGSIATEVLSDIAQTLGFASLTVCDSTGLVVGDADGQGIGQYNFGQNEQTAKYMALIDGTTDFIVEEPRVSIDAQGNETGGVQVFGGMPRSAGGGFIQASITADEYSGLLDAASIKDIANNYNIGEGGLIVVARDGTVVSSNNSSHIGDSFSEFVKQGSGVTVSDDFYRRTTLTEFYLGQGDSIGYARAAQISYVRAAQAGDYQILAAVPSDYVYSSRPTAMMLIAGVFLVLFGAVFVLAMQLLHHVVVRGFDETNDVLARITEGDLSQRVEVHGSTEFDSLSSGINTTVDALKESIEEARARIDRELATAKAIQEAALPSTFPPFPDVDQFDIFASMNAAKEVGGDFYDFFLVDENRLGFLIADVSGKGIPAALFMMTAKTEIENCIQSTPDLSAAIATANHHLCQGNEAGMFVTVFACVLDYKTGILQYVNAGHNPPLLRHDGAWEWLHEKSGVFLGTFDGVKYKLFERTLSANDELLLYTDGVSEAMNVSEELYGEERLERLLGKHSAEPPRRLVESVQRDLRRYGAGADQFDDITMLCLEYGRKPEYSGSILVDASIDSLADVQEYLHAQARRYLCPEGVQTKLDICLEELFVNVARYAYPEATDENPGHVRMTCTFDPDLSELEIELRDEGVPFNPIEKPDPEKPGSIEEAQIGGLGIFMTKKIADRVEYCRDDDCNVVTFAKGW